MSGISQDLFLALLSMDAYNRGYGAGISDGQHLDEEGNDLGLGEGGSIIGITVTVTVIIA